MTNAIFDPVFRDRHALACSGVKWANRGGVYLFFLPDSS